MNVRAVRLKLLVTLLIALILAVLLQFHAPFMNGPYYWKWPWRRLGTWRYFPAMLACAAPIVPAVLLYDLRRWRMVISIALVMLAMLAMQIVHVGLTVKPFNLNRITYFVESPMTTSYYADAIRSMDIPTTELLARYPEYLPQFDMHSREKPPGPILFFRTILALAGVSDRTAMLGGLIISLLTTLGVPATYALIRVLLKDHQSAFVGCVMLALCPGLTLNLPMLDQVYPVFTCALIIAWVMALRSGKIRWAIGFGAILASSCFVVYHFLVLGAFLGMASIVWMVAAPKERMGSLVELSLAAVATCGLLYFAFFALTGFHAIDVFHAALANQAEMLAPLHRPYPRTILFDLTDFAMGAGWIPWLLAILAVMNLQIEPSKRMWGWLAISQIVILAITGLMQAETARVWCFLLPLLILPASAELSRWPRWAQISVFASMWALLCCVGQNLAFMY